MINVQDQYDEKRKDADDFRPVQIDLLKKLFDCDYVTVANENQDKTEVTDAVVFDNFKIALRVRDHKYFEGCWHEATVRSTGTKTSEASKIDAGHGDWFLYGFRTPDRTAYQAWSLLWLPAYRLAKLELQKNHWTAKIAAGETTNDEACDRRIEISSAIKILHPLNGQNPFETINLPKLTNLGFPVIHDTSDERLVTPDAKLWAPEGYLRGVK